MIRDFLFASSAVRVLAFCCVLVVIMLQFKPLSAQDCSCGAPCYVLLDNDSLFGVDDFIACLTIEVGPDIVVESSADVSFSAGESIIMSGSILVKDDATVAMDIDPLLYCDLAADLDEDLVNACLDCNDANSSVYPGATETCDGLDNDCDTLTDEDTCDDGVACTVDNCNSLDQGCEHVPNNSNCDDGNPCTIDSCNPTISGDPATGCYYDVDAANGMPCDDGNPATSGETCQAGVCSVSCDRCCAVGPKGCAFGAFCSSEPCEFQACSAAYCEIP